MLTRCKLLTAGSHDDRPDNLVTPPLVCDVRDAEARRCSAVGRQRAISNMDLDFVVDVDGDLDLDVLALR